MFTYQEDFPVRNPITQRRHRFGASRTLLTLTRRALIAAMVTAASVCTAQSYPLKAVRVIVPFAASSTVDILSRLISKNLSDAIGQPVLVENQPGAGGVLAGNAAMGAPADGYTVIHFVSTQLALGSMIKSATFDIKRDFIPLAIVANAPNVMLVSNAVPAKSLEELIALAKANPKLLDYAHTGVGTPTHLFMESFMRSAGIQMLAVPYKSGSQAITELAGGQVQVMFNNVGSAMPLLKAGRFRALAVSSAQRLPLLPNVPTVAETLPGFEATVWFGFFVRAGTPPDIVARMSSEIARIAAMPAVQSAVLDIGLTPEIITGEKAIAKLRVDTDAMTQLIQAIGIKPQ